MDNIGAIFVIWLHNTFQIENPQCTTAFTSAPSTQYKTQGFLKPDGQRHLSHWCHKWSPQSGWVGGRVCGQIGGDCALVGPHRRSHPTAPPQPSVRMGKACASVLNTCLSGESSALLSEKSRKKYLSVSPRKKLSILSRGSGLEGLRTLFMEE